MSQENVVVIKEVYDAINRDDMSTASSLMTPDVAWVNPSYAVETGTRIGREGFGAAIDNVREMFPAFEYSLETVEVRGDHVLVRAALRGLSKSGGEMSWSRYHVWTLRDGKVCCFRWFSDQAEALEAVGLSG